MKFKEKHMSNILYIYIFIIVIIIIIIINNEYSK